MDNNNNNNKRSQQSNAIAALMMKYVDPADQAMLQQVSSKLKFFQEQMTNNMANGDMMKNQQLMMQYQQLQQQQGHLMYKIQQQIQNGKARERMSNDNNNNDNKGTDIISDNMTSSDNINSNEISMDNSNHMDNGVNKGSPFQLPQKYRQPSNHSTPIPNSPNIMPPNLIKRAINENNDLGSVSRNNSFDAMINKTNSTINNTNIPTNIDSIAANSMETPIIVSGMGTPMVSSAMGTPTHTSHVGTPRSNMGTPLIQPGNLQKIGAGGKNPVKSGDIISQINNPQQQQQQQQQPQQGMTPQQQQSAMDMKKKASLQVQTELFMKTLTDFLRSKQKALDPQKVIIDNRVISMFLLYFFVNKLGGFQSVTNSNQWEVVARRLNLVTPANESNAEIFSTRLFHCYKEYLAEFDSFLKTPDGQKQLDLNKKQKLLEIQQRAKMNPGMFSMMTAQQQQQQPQQQPIMNKQQQPTSINRSQQLGNLPIMATMQAPQGNISMNQQQQLAQQMAMRNAAVKANSISLQGNPPPPPMSADMNIHQIPQGVPVKSIPPGSAGTLNSNTSKQSVSPMPSILKQATSVHTVPQVPPKSVAPVAPQLVITKKYDPIIRQIQTHAGYDIKKLIIDGEQLESVKPNYLFPPEGGLINIHALSMALDSGSLSEVNNVLNMLLVTSSDPKLFFDFNECRELLDRICEVGMNVLDELIHIFENDLVLNVNIYDEKLNKKKNGNKAETRRLFKNKFVEVKEEYNIYDKYYSENVDDTIIAKKRKFHEIELEVDSFTGEEEKQGAAMNKSEYVMNDFFITPKDVKYTQFDYGRPEKEIKKLGIPLYVDLLVKTNDEMCDIFSEMNVRASENYQIMLVDQLVIITMILRNVCFYKPNQQLLCDHKVLHSFIFKLLSCLFGKDELFVYSRRKLSILKNVLTIMMNVAHLFKLQSFDEAMFIILLVLEFGGDPVRCKDKVIMDYQEMLHKMTGIAIDMFTKLLANSKENRFLVKCVLTGRYTPSQLLQPQSTQQNAKKTCNVVLDDELDAEEDFSESLYPKFGISKNSINSSISAYKLSKLFIEHETNDTSMTPESGYLFQRIFSLLISVVPLTAPNASIIANMVKQHAALSLQSLFSLTLISKMLPLKGEMNLAMKWLCTSENIGSSLLRISFICGLSKEQNLTLTKVAVQSLKLCSYLIYKAVKFVEFNGNDDNEENRNELKKLNQIPKLFPTENNTFATMMAPNSDPRIVNEILKLSGYEKQIMNAVVMMKEK